MEPEIKIWNNWLDLIAIRQRGVRPVRVPVMRSLMRMVEVRDALEMKAVGAISRIGHAWLPSMLTRSSGPQQGALLIELSHCELDGKVKEITGFLKSQLTPLESMMCRDGAMWIEGPAGQLCIAIEYFGSGERIAWSDDQRVCSAFNRRISTRKARAIWLKWRETDRIEEFNSKVVDFLSRNNLKVRIPNPVDRMPLAIAYSDSLLSHKAMPVYWLFSDTGLRQRSLEREFW